MRPLISQGGGEPAADRDPPRLAGALRRARRPSRAAAAASAGIEVESGDRACRPGTASAARRRRCEPSLSRRAGAANALRGRRRCAWRGEVDDQVDPLARADQDPAARAAGFGISPASVPIWVIVGAAADREVVGAEVARR